MKIDQYFFSIKYFLMILLSITSLSLFAINSPNIFIKLTKDKDGNIINGTLDTESLKTKVTDKINSSGQNIVSSLEIFKLKQITSGMPICNLSNKSVIVFAPDNNYRICDGTYWRKIRSN